MSNTPNPELTGLTAQEKRAVMARNWQEANREEYREYQREYHRNYNKDPRKVALRLQRRLDEIKAITTRIQLKYDSMLTPYLNEADLLNAQLTQAQEKIASGQLNYTPRNGV